MAVPEAILISLDLPCCFQVDRFPLSTSEIDLPLSTTKRIILYLIMEHNFASDRCSDLTNWNYLAHGDTRDDMENRGGTPFNTSENQKSDPEEGEIEKEGIRTK